MISLKGTVCPFLTCLPGVRLYCRVLREEEKAITCMRLLRSTSINDTNQHSLRTPHSLLETPHSVLVSASQ